MAVTRSLQQLRRCPPVRYTDVRHVVHDPLSDHRHRTLDLPELTCPAISGDDSTWPAHRSARDADQRPVRQRAHGVERPAILRAGDALTLHFRVDATCAATDLEPYMGRAAHAEIVRSDVAVFAHNPSNRSSDVRPSPSPAIRTPATSWPRPLRRSCRSRTAFRRPARTGSSCRSNVRAASRPRIRRGHRAAAVESGVRWSFASLAWSRRLQSSQPPTPAPAPASERVQSPPSCANKPQPATHFDTIDAAVAIDAPIDAAPSYVPTHFSVEVRGTGRRSS